MSDPIARMRMQLTLRKDCVDYLTSYAKIYWDGDRPAALEDIIIMAAAPLYVQESHAWQKAKNHREKIEDIKNGE